MADSAPSFTEPPLGRRLSGLARAHWPLLLPAFLYLSIFPYQPALRSPNELCRLAQTRAIVDHGTLALDQTMGEYGWVGDLSVHQGRHYPAKAPLLSFAAVPVYAVLKVLRGGDGHAVGELALVYFSRLFVLVLPSLLALIPLRRFLRGFAPPRIADGVLAAYAGGTLAFSHAELYMSHQITALLLFFSFWALYRGHQLPLPPTPSSTAWRGGLNIAAFRHGGMYILGGLLFGLAVLSEYSAGLLLPPLLGYAALGGRRRVAPLALFLAGGIPTGLAFAAYHWAAFGRPLTSAYAFVESPVFQSWHAVGFMGVGIPSLGNLAYSLFSPLRGLFVLSPILALAIPGFVALWRQPSLRKESGFLLAIAACYLYFTSSYPPEHWGWSTGARHLTPVVLFLLPPVAFFFGSSGGPKWRLAQAIGAGLALVSVLATGLMTLINYFPDDMRNGLFDLALPLLLKGYLPPSPLTFWGVPNPWAALPALLALLALGLAAFWALLPRPLVAQGVLAALAATVLLPLAHSRFVAEPRPGVPDAFSFMSSIWQPRPGQPSPPLFAPR